MIIPRYLLPEKCFWLLLLFPLIFSCKKNKSANIPAKDQMNNEEAFAILEGALMTEAEGLMREILTAIDVWEVQIQEDAPNPHCDLADNLNLANIFDNDRFQGTYRINRQWLLSCLDQASPAYLTYSWDGDITYESLEFSEEAYTDGNLQLSLEPARGDWIVSGSYERTGQQYSKFFTGNIYDTSFFLDFQELIVDRQKRSGRSGSATFDLSGAIAGGRTFYIGGNIEFLENGWAEVTIGDQLYGFYPFE